MMINEFPGQGRKRPQVDIPLDYIELDNLNPRLADEHKGGTQLDIISVLYNEFNLEEITYSMAENGYFDEEPIVVVAKNLPNNFWTDNVDEDQKKLEELIKTDTNIRFIVIEGNRRIASAKLLVHKSLHKHLEISSDDFPELKAEAKIDLQLIPSIVYKKREHISPYLGVRHIVGVLKWEAYAKAKYIAARIEEGRKKGKSIEESIKDVQKKTADRSDVIKKQYMAYKIFEQARDDINFDTSEIIHRFSLITVALSSPSIREYIGVPFYKEAKFNKPFVPRNKFKNFGRILIWIFGKGKEKPPIITDSRNITSRLAPILADKDATLYLEDYENIEEAFERSGGDKVYIMNQIKKARRAVERAMQYAYKFKSNKEIAILIDELIMSIDQLRKNILK